MGTTTRWAVFAGVAAAAVLFAALLSEVGPSAADARAALALAGGAAGGSEGGRMPPLASLAARLLLALSAGPGVLRGLLVALHVAAALLAGRAVERMAGRRAGAAAAVLFALHPLHAGLYASPLAAGIPAALPVLLLLLALEALAAARARGAGACGLTACAAAMFLAGLAGGGLAVPVVLAGFDLFAFSHKKGLRRLGLHAGLLALYGSAALAAGVLVPSIPPWNGDELLVLGDVLAARSWAGEMAGPWGSPALLFVALLAALAVAARLRAEGVLFLVPFARLGALLAAAALAGLRAPQSIEGPAIAALLPLVFFAGCGGLLAAGDGPTAPGRRDKRRRAADAGGLLAGAACAAGSIVLALLLGAAIRQADGAADRTAAAVVAAAGGEAPRGGLFLFHRVLAAPTGQRPLVAFHGHDLIPRLSALLKNASPPIFLIEDRDDFDELDRIFLASRPGAALMSAGGDGTVVKLQLTREDLDRLAMFTRPLAMDRPDEESRLVLGRNGLPVSITPPPPARAFRVVLLTPVGPFVASQFDTRARYASGVETFFLNDPGLQRDLPLFDNWNVVAWAEAYAPGEEVRYRSRPVMFRLRGERDAR